MILISYDGSPDSRAAVEQAADLFADQPATVLTVWEPFVEMAARSSLGLGLVPFTPDPEEIAKRAASRLSRPPPTERRWRASSA